MPLFREDRTKTVRRVVVGVLVATWFIVMSVLEIWRRAGGDSSAAGWMMIITFIIIILWMVLPLLIGFFGGILDDRTWKTHDKDFGTHGALIDSEAYVARQLSQQRKRTANDTR